MFILYCRAGDLARRTDGFLNFNNVRRGQDPALQSGAYGQFARNPRATVHPYREAYMPPLQIRVPRTRTKNVTTGQTPTGRIHAAPTNRPGMADKWVRQAFAAGRPACERGRGFRTGARMSLAGRKETVL